MSNAQIDDELLNRYADGDLSASEAEAVKSTLSADAGAQSQYQAILQLRNMMDAAGREMALGAEPERMFAAIEAGIARDAAEAQQPASAEQAEPGFWARLFDTRAWMPATGALAALSAVLLTIYSPVDPSDVVPPAPIGATDSQHPDESAATDDLATDETGDTAAAAVPTVIVRSEIVEVDFGQNAGTVFEIALENGSSTPVVWINDDD